MKKLFEERFQKFRNNEAVKIALKEIKQKPNKLMLIYIICMKIIAASMTNEAVIDHNMKNYFVKGLNKKLRSMMHMHPLKSFKNAQELAFDFEAEMDAQIGVHNPLFFSLQKELRELKKTSARNSSIKERKQKRNKKSKL